MDLNEHELAELEERLYSRIHHAAEGSADDNVSTEATAAAAAVPGGSAAAGPVRLVTDKSIINNARQTASVASSKIKRYWDSLQQQNSRLSYPGIRQPRRAVPELTEVRDGCGAAEGAAVQPRKVFTPYKSILGSLGSGLLREDDHPLPTIDNLEDKQKRRKNTQKDGKRNNPAGSRNRKMDQLKKIKVKKSKALKSRQKAGGLGEQRLVATIDLDTSSEEEGEYVSPDPIKQEKKEKESEERHEDSDPDEVVLIPTAPPPLVCIEDSEDDATKDGFTQPKSKKKKQSKKTRSPRCVSPSNSSIMSDDFIGHSDRTRFNDSFIEGINNDEELDCTAPHTVGSLLAGERRVFGDIAREARAPSISSDCTVATSSDTTDPDKRNGLKPNQSIGGQTLGTPKLSSTPKQILPSKRAVVVAKPSKCVEDDSIYAATSAKKAKAATEKNPTSGSSSEESDDGNISSHSKRSKSYQSDTSTKSLLKRRKKRRKQDSEHYSDEDFASMLTDIVQAISENEEDSSEEEEETPLMEIADASLQEREQSPQSPREALFIDQSDDVQEVQEEPEPPTDISLPQINQTMEVASPTMVKNDPQETKSTPEQPVPETESVPLAPPPPVITVADEESQPNRSQRENQHQERIDDADDDMCGIRRIDHDPECGWNDEMRKFYNDSWNCEDFNISTVLFNMPRSNKYWPIVHKDKYPDPPKKEIICNNCGERGHMRYKCRNPPKPKTCYMCGLPGHQEVRCPNTLCLKCGEKTKNFLRGCPSCAREQNMTCHLCGVRGHGQRNCPDKWRRYHSTTEDHKPLTQQYIRNPNARHCCICSRVGHQAHMCGAALKIFGQFVTTTEIKSYQPLYNINEQSRQENQNRGPKFNMFSDMTDYELNFDDSFAANENSFYYRFAKSVGIIEEKKRKAEKVARKLKREERKRRKAEGNRNEAICSNETVVIDDDSKDLEHSADRAKMSPPQTITNSTQTKSVNEDSNYSFSEFYEANTTNLPQSSEPMPDFIPLVAPETAIVPVPSVEQPTDAKIFLTKPHAKILLGPIGAAFLKDASSKFSLKVSILFQTVGNVLLANGLSTDQDNFHNELVKFLNNASHQNEQLKLINNVPKATEKTIRYIIDHLVLLTRSYENAKVLFKRYQHFEEQGANTKTCDKIRRTLNIILFGQYGLRAGREHLTKLQSNLKHLQDTQEANVSTDFRDEINQHIRYIFTSFDHTDYEDILNEYEKLRRFKKLNKIKPEELDLPKLPPLTAGVEPISKSDDSFNFSKDLNFDNSCNEPSSSNTYDEDLILNTSDQLIDTTRPADNYDDQFDEDPDQYVQNQSFANFTPKPKKHSSKKHRVDTLLEECSHMVTMLNNTPITEKFERISNQTRRGHLSKANYRTLVGIHSVLRNRLNRKLPFRK
ncbi:uncharacterized protein LOC109431655 [Aedes albopictus]|uniref:Zinc finger CCHC domain-containing protein 7 n=1 Tax=Aedes albopictus TaxID=7160 RepID=A0ABM1XST5_AEDAL